MLRPRPLAILIAALALLGATLLFAPIASTQGPVPTLSPTPPVQLAPPTTTPRPPSKLPRTGLEIGLVVLVGLGLLGMGTVLPRARVGPPSRRRG